ncbi:MAG: acetolactate synthase [Lachnospiraceae bacterium]|nr:acetolactate synthase [Lachnospiraceae bacterium]
MAVNQLSVFIENKHGRLSEAIKGISESELNIRALSIGDSQDFGIVRMIVSDLDKAKELLGEEFIYKVTPVIAVKMDDKGGALYKILKTLEESEINVKYTYAFTSNKEFGAYVVLRVDDVTATEKILSDKGFRLATDEEISG